MRETTKVIAFPVFFVGVGPATLPFQRSSSIKQNLFVGFKGDDVNIIFQGFDKQAAHNINNQNYIHIEEVNEGIGLYTVTSTQIFGAKKEFVKFCNFTDENNPLVEIGQNYPRIKNCLTEFTNVHITFEALHPFNNSISTHNAWQDNKKNRMLNHNRLTEYLYFAQEVEVCVPVIKE